METIRLTRGPYENDKTIGKIEYGDFAAYTLELPWKDNASRVSCIPEGEYELVWRQTTKVRRGFTWGLRGGTVGLFEGGQRNNILIHSANKPADILGCIGLGYVKTAQGIGNSRAAVDDFLNLTFGKKIKLIITGSGTPQGISPPTPTPTLPPDVIDEVNKPLTIERQYKDVDPSGPPVVFDETIGGVVSGPIGVPSEYLPKRASTPDSSICKSAVWTNRVPDKEPWPRTLMIDSENLNDVTDDEHLKNVSHVPQFNNEGESGRKDIGKIEGNERIERGKLWRR